MSTRATYQINKTTFYCHWDGYPTGAAQRFANMVAALTVPGDADSMQTVADRRGGFEYAFIRGNFDAEPTEGRDAHGDTEFHYTLTVESGGFAKIKVEAASYVSRIDSRFWRTKYVGDLAEWLNLQRAALAEDLRVHYAERQVYADANAEAAQAIPAIFRMIEMRELVYSEHAFATYATLEAATAILEREKAQVAHFDQFPMLLSTGEKRDNPNKSVHAHRVAAWESAITGTSATQTAVA